MENNLRYGAAVDRTVPDFNQKEFVKNYSSSIVVPEKDELASILRYDDAVNFSDDASLLLNQKRLDGIDPKAVADIIRKRFSERNVTSQFDGLTDAEIFSQIKGRGIQTMSELDRYSEYLANSLGVSISERERQQKELEIKKDDSKTSESET